MRFLALLVLLFGLMGASVARAPERPSVEHAATFWLGFTDGTCSGTAIGPNLMLSAAHCFEGPGKLAKVSGRPCQMIGEPVLDGNDHAIIRTTCHFPRWAEMGGQLRQGVEVHFWGNPKGLSDIFRRGYVMGSEDGWFMIDALVNNGDSGAGLFDHRGRVVSVVSTLFGQGPYFHCMGAKPLLFTQAQYASVGL